MSEDIAKNLQAQEISAAMIEATDSRELQAVLQRQQLMERPSVKDVVVFPSQKPSIESPHDRRRQITLLHDVLSQHRVCSMDRCIIRLNCIVKSKEQDIDTVGLLLASHPHQVIGTSDPRACWQDTEIAISEATVLVPLVRGPALRTC